MLACRSRFAQHLTSDESFESFPVIETMSGCVLQLRGVAE